MPGKQQRVLPIEISSQPAVTTIPTWKVRLNCIVLYLFTITSSLTYNNTCNNTLEMRNCDRGNITQTYGYYSGKCE